MNAGRRRERGREGRKQGGELEWATVPVFGLHGLNFKHAYCSSTCLRARTDMSGLLGHRWHESCFTFIYLLAALLRKALEEMEML